VNPLLFNLRMTLSAENFIIEKIYGSPDMNEPSRLAGGECLFVNTLFPSRMTQDGQTKGGIMLLKLKTVEEKENEEEEEEKEKQEKELTRRRRERYSQAIIDISSENREGNVESETFEICLVKKKTRRKGSSLSRRQKLHQEEGKGEEGEEDKDNDHLYETVGIRKAILLARYVTQMHTWLKFEDHKVRQQHQQTTQQQQGPAPFHFGPTLSLALIGAGGKGGSVSSIQSSPSRILPEEEEIKEGLVRLLTYVQNEMEAIRDPLLEQEARIVRRVLQHYLGEEKDKLKKTYSFLGFYEYELALANAVALPSEDDEEL
jgi:hypothetical protein